MSHFRDSGQIDNSLSKLCSGMAAGSGGRLFEERRQLKVKLHFTGFQAFEECNDHFEKSFFGI